MWYLPESAGDDGYFDDPNVTCYATSRDGVHWEKPLVGTLKAKNGKPHNAVAYIHQASVMKDLRESDPAKRYKCVGCSIAAVRLQRLRLAGRPELDAVWR